MKKYITEPKKKIKVYGKYDVVVCGGGPAGVAAAVSAARNGLKTIIIEQTGCFGGMGTAGLVPCFCPYSYSDEPFIKGIGFEILERLRAKQGTGGNVKGFVWVAIDAEKLKLVYDEMIKECKVKTLFFTFFSDVIKKGNSIKGIIIDNKSGRQVIFGKIIIDATGDADVAAKSGVPFAKGDKRGKLQGVTCCFNVAGVDTKRFKSWRNKLKKGQFDRIVANEQKHGGLLKPFPDAEYRLNCLHNAYPDILGFNAFHTFNIDGTKADDLTYAITRGRELAHFYVEMAKKKFPGFKNAKIASTATLPGIRETRLIKGEYKLTADDFFKSRSFYDNIGVYDYYIDIHNSGKTLKSIKASHKMIHYQPKGKYYGIPYRSILPKGINNLLVPGRSLSSDRVMQGSIRVMPACFAMGEAAGAAAKLAIKQNCALKNICIDKLQLALVKQGARIY